MVFLSLSLVLFSSALYGYLQNRQLETYLLRLTELGHHIIHLRDEVILASHQSPFPAAKLMADLEAVEVAVTRFQRNDGGMIPDILYPGALAQISETFYTATLGLTLQLTDLVDISVQHEHRQPVDPMTMNSIPLTVDVMLVYSPEQAQLHRLLLSEERVDFVEQSEMQISEMQMAYRDLNAINALLYLLLLMVMIVLVAKVRVNDLKVINAVIQDEKAKAEAASQAKSVFLATMSHELRTPMNGVLGIAQLIESETQEPETKEQAKIIMDSGQHLLTLLNDILDFSKIEEGKMTLEQVTFSLEGVIAHLDTTLRPLAVVKPIGFHLYNHVPANAQLEGDVARFRQILFNLIGNAIKFTEQGHVDVEFIPINDTLRVVVRDTGIGIPNEKLDTIFTPFEQAENSTTRRFGGTGLGLAIVKEITQLMGGTLSVTSREGIGSEFTVDLPFLISHDIDMDPLFTSASPPCMNMTYSDSQGLKVLLVEDNAVNAMVAKRFCEKEGHQVTHCLDAMKAIEVLKQTAFDVILMDNHMPGLMGSEAIRIIRQELKIKTVIFACTADVFEAAHEEFIRNGANYVLTKPMQAHRLYQAIDQFSDEIARYGASAVKQEESAILG
ncbi:sensor histidine kinase [Photobacterium aphoticum]|uniref:histidine kinase n=1 Tax=Photobacterium aphoticum TaxID=754436 RepID=A0A090QIC3_9GAMM|nr:sensor histidine kinase [Photobacterium aphoticum]